MEKSEIVEKDILIAEFMNVYSKGQVPKFDYSWSWSCLMLVVEKIEATKFTFYNQEITYTGFSIVGNFCSVMIYTSKGQPLCIFQTPCGTEPKSKISATYDAVVNFIIEFNKVKTNP